MYHSGDNDIYSLLLDEKKNVETKLFYRNFYSLSNLLLMHISHKGHVLRETLLEIFYALNCKVKSVVTRITTRASRFLGGENPLSYMSTGAGLRELFASTHLA